MAIKYIDPDHGGTNSGTLDNPWTSWDSAVITNNAGDEFLQKRGTTDVMTGDIYLDTRTAGLTLGAYYNADGTDDTTQPKPIVQFTRTSTLTGDWTLTETGVYELTHGSTIYGMALLGLGALGVVGTKRPYDAPVGGDSPIDGQASLTNLENANEGDWGHDKTLDRLYIRCDDNPVTRWGTIYYSTSDDGCIYARNCDNVEIKDLELQHCYQGIRFLVGGSNTSSSCHIHNVTIRNCHIGILWDSDPTSATASHDDCSVYDCYITNCYAGGIHFYSYTTDCAVYNNVITDCLLAESTAGIYGRNVSPSTQELQVYGNEVSGGTYGNFWLDGDGIYADNGSEGWDIYNNYVHDLPDDNMCAYIDNSGGPRITFHNNVADGAYYFVTVNDSNPSANAGDTGFTFKNNTGVNLVDGIRLKGGNVDTGTVVWENNIMVGTGVAVDDSGNATTKTRGYNDYSGFSDTTYVVSNETNSLLLDPELDSDYFPALTSPCIQAGTTKLSEYDFHGRPNEGVGDHIGAKWPNYGGSASVRRKL